MKIRIRAFGDLAASLGNESFVELEANSTVKDLVYKLSERTGSPRKGFLGHYDVRGPELVVLLNGQNINALKKLETHLKDGDVVTFLPPVVGG